MKRRWRFTPAVIAYAPDGAGVYALWKGDEIATHYSWELARRPAVRESELLSEFWLARGCFPCCNEAETVERVVKKLQA